MRTLPKVLSLLFLLAALILVYTLRLYGLCSVLVLLAWVSVLLAGAYCRSRWLLRFGALCWLCILAGFALSLAFPVPDPALPAALALLRAVYYAVFLLPLSGLPALHIVCIPISLLMLALHGLAYWRTRRLGAYYEL